jgi:hypothetical protein
MEVGGQLQALAVIPLDKNLGAHCIGDCMGPTADLDVLEKKKSLSSVCKGKGKGIPLQAWTGP